MFSSNQIKSITQRVVQMDVHVTVNVCWKMASTAAPVLKVGLEVIAQSLSNFRVTTTKTTMKVTFSGALHVSFM